MIHDGVYHSHGPGLPCRPMCRCRCRRRNAAINCRRGGNTSWGRPRPSDCGTGLSHPKRRHLRIRPMAYTFVTGLGKFLNPCAVAGLNAVKSPIPAFHLPLAVFAPAVAERETVYRGHPCGGRRRNLCIGQSRSTSESACPGPWHRMARSASQTAHAICCAAV